MKLEELIKAQGRLNENELLIYNSKLKKYLKSTWKAYYFFFLLGWFGFHKFYLEKSDEGILYLIVGLISLNADFNFDLDRPNLSTLTFLVQIIHLMYDFFTIPSNISKYEINLRTELLGEFGIFFNKFNMEIDDLSEAENTLSENDFLEYNLLLEKKIINVEQAYIGLFFVGWLGLHKFLFGKILQGISYLCLSSIGLYALVLHIVTGAPIYRSFFMIYVFLLIWDSFLLYSEVYVHNQEVRKFIKFKNKIEQKEQYEKELINSLERQLRQHQLWK
jgi:TM2 domain-containing membrane protein YozV